MLPPAPTYFHKPVSALNAHGGESSALHGAVPQLRGRYRDRDRPGLPERLTRRCRRHRRLHDRERLRPARLPRHRRGLDAAREGVGHAVPDRAGPRRRLGLPRQAIRTLVNGAVVQDGNTTRWNGTCITSSPTSRGRSRSSRATCCCRDPANSRRSTRRRRGGRGRRARPARDTIVDGDADPRRRRRPAERARRRSPRPRLAGLGVPRHPATPALRRTVRGSVGRSDSGVITVDLANAGAPGRRSSARRTSGSPCRSWSGPRRPRSSRPSRCGSRSPTGRRSCSGRSRPTRTFTRPPSDRALRGPRPDLGHLAVPRPGAPGRQAGGRQGPGHRLRGHRQLAARRAAPPQVATGHTMASIGAPMQGEYIVLRSARSPPATTPSGSASSAPRTARSSAEKTVSFSVK